MRVVIHDQVSDKFIEGPMQSAPTSSFQDGPYEKVTGQTDFNQAFGAEDNAGDINDTFYEANERYD